MTTNSDQLAIAIQHHQEGRLQVAEQIYRQILQSDPNHADALHLLGVIAHQVGNHIVAIDSIGRSIQLNPNQAHVYNNLGGAYRALQRFLEAVACYRRALELKPDDVETLLNLGNALTDLGRLDEAVLCFGQAVELKPDLAAAHLNLGNALKRQGKLGEAVASYYRTLELQPDDVETRMNLGNGLREQGKLDEAVGCYRQVLKRIPNLAVAHLNQGVVLKELGKLDEAIACYYRALELEPEFAEAFNNLGVALNDQQKLDDAVNCYHRALELKPDYADAYNNIGNAFSSQGKLDHAVTCYRKSLELQPGSARVHTNLGGVLKRQGKLDGAIACYQLSLHLNPISAEALSGLGATLKAQGKLDEAAVSCRRAIELKPDYAEGHNHLGNVLKDQGRLDEAIECYRRAVELRPDDAEAHSNLVYTLLFSPGYDRQALLEEHRQWNESHAASLAAIVQSHPNDRSPDRRLRIGYVSPDFRNHVVGRNLLPLFREHNHHFFEVFCYADVPCQDELTSRFRSHADLFHNTAGLSDEQLTQRVHEDRIDILVDLTLHMAHNRLRVFARKPAPVQVTFAGYPGTTGLTAIDYRITDRHLDPPGLHDDCYSEESFRLPDSFWCYDPLSEQVVNPLPAIENGYLTFGCLNNFCKINTPILKMWAQILKIVDRSRLMILAAEGKHRQHALQVLFDEGIADDRITFVVNQPRQPYLRNYHSIDIGLDTLPYNGHTTSLDSFWMGVPVVTLVGATVTGRAGLSQLMNLGLPELIADSPEQFVHIAVELARDLPRLSGLRATLRGTMQRSPLMDAVCFTRSIEAVYREIWRRWCES